MPFRHSEKLIAHLEGLLAWGVLFLLAPFSCSTNGPSESRSNIVELRITSNHPLSETSRSIVGPMGQKLYVSDETLITDRHISSGILTTLNDGKVALSFTLTEDGQKALESQAETYVGNFIAIYLNGQLVSTPLVHTPLHQRFMVNPTDGFSVDQANRILDDLEKRHLE